MYNIHEEPNIIKNLSIIIDGMTCSTCSNTIETHLNSVSGIVAASVSLLTHKASIQYQTKKIGIRSIIEEIESLGFGGKYESKSDKADIRNILKKSVKKQFIKFIFCLILVIPIIWMTMIYKFIDPNFVTRNNEANGVPLFAYLVGAFSTLIQFVIGQ